MTKQNIGLFLAIILGLFSIIVLKRITNKKHAQWHIGILQTATHPALDITRESFIQEIKNTLNGDVQIIIQNAEGSMNAMHTMAQSLQTQQDIDLFFAIATPAAQSLASLEKERPIIFAAVTDPIAADLTTPMHTNICGSIDMIDAHKQVELLQALAPSAKTIGILFNKGEVNAQSSVQQLHMALTKADLSVIPFGVINEAEIPSAIEIACRKADVIITPIDNTVACTIDVIAKTTHRMRVPLIVSDNLLVTKGALAAQGVDYAESGRQAAKLAQHILQDRKPPQELPIQMPHCKAVINKKELDHLQLTVPHTMDGVELIAEEQ